MSFMPNEEGFHAHPLSKAALEHTERKVFWADSPEKMANSPSLQINIKTDLLIVGSGLTGLWAALQAIEEYPNRKVTVLEAETTGFGASTRNAGFCDVSLTHTIANGLFHWKDDYPVLHRMGLENMDGMLATLQQHQIDASVEKTGFLIFAVEPWQIADLQEDHELYLKYGAKSHWMNQQEAQACVKSPTYFGGLKVLDGSIMINPAQLVWGLKKTCEALGVQFYDHSKVVNLQAHKDYLEVETGNGTKIQAQKAVIATNAWGNPNEKEKNNHIIPIHDYVLVTEPLSATQLASIGWEGREGLEDGYNQFHYYRLTKDNRILWGGYEGKYYHNDVIDCQRESPNGSYEQLAAHFFHTFPQLEGLQFTHKWSGPIGSTSKFAAAFGTKHNNRLAWAAGYTGLGVGASRFGARVALDLVDGKQTERTALKMVRQKPLPFPPAPFRTPIVEYTMKQVALADKNQGKRGWWLKCLDTFGVGFES